MFNKCLVTECIDRWISEWNHLMILILNTYPLTLRIPDFQVTIFSGHATSFDLLFWGRKRGREEKDKTIIVKTEPAKSWNVFMFHGAISSYYRSFPEQKVFKPSCTHYSCYCRVRREAYFCLKHLFIHACICWTYA